jgi:hypothetical protein
MFFDWIILVFLPLEKSRLTMKPKIKSITKYLTTYNRVNTYDDTIVEDKRMIAYAAYDPNGNLCCDKTYNTDGHCENMIQRNYNEKNQLIEESFYDGIEEVSYESRTYSFGENDLICACKVKYSEEEILEKFVYDDEDKLIEKHIVYADGSQYCENKYSWKDKHLVEEIECDDEDSVCVRKKYFYDEQDRLVVFELEEVMQDNKMKESYEYDEHGPVVQKTYNLKGELMATRTYAYNENGLMIEQMIETPSQYIKYVYTYSDDDLLVVESMFNHDDRELSRREMKYNENKDEVSINVYSLNIVDNNDELLLVENYSSEYEYYS